MNMKSLITVAAAVLVAGCGARHASNAPQNTSAIVSDQSALVTVATCHQPDDAAENALVMIAKTADGAPVSPNSTNAMLVLFFQNRPEAENKFAYPVNLREDDSSVTIEGASWATNIGMVVGIDRSSGAGHYQDALQSFDLSCKVYSGK